VALIVKQTVKDWLKITQTTDDALLDTICAEAEGLFLKMTDRIIESAQVTETRNGRGKSAMMLRYEPVTAILGVAVDGVALPARTNVMGTGYVSDGYGKLSLVGFTFNEGVQNVVVVYQAGYATVPADITSALRDACAYWYQQRDRIGFKSKAIGGEIISFMTSDVPPIFATLVKKYQRVYQIER
jgi:hypothetical protein